MNRSRNTLKSRLFNTFILSILFILVTFAFSLLSSNKLQNIGQRRFIDEEYFIEVEEVMAAIQQPLISYLSLFSTTALSDVMMNIDKLEELIPSERRRPINSTDAELIKRQIYFLIDQYISDVESIIILKRGRKVDEYSQALDELNRLYAYILIRIDEFSLNGYKTQVEEYNNFLILFKNQQLYNLVLVILVVFIIFSILMRSVNDITRPLYKLSTMADQIREGNFNVDDTEVDSVEEINRVSKTFNSMKNSIRHYIDELNKQKELERDIMTQRIRNMKMEQLLKRMELYTMQAQMNPHFLFNTINTGVQLAIIEEADRTADYMENLAEVFRYNIREKRFFVPLRDEYEGVVSYINILKIRFPHSIRVTADVDIDLLDEYYCPAMILQPLIENSIVHAFKNSEGVGEIILTIKMLEKKLYIAVKDNGVGIDEDIIDELLIPHTHEYEVNSKVMGLENVIQRCFFFYPEDEDVISIKSKKGAGTEIIIQIDPEVEPCIEL